jgi:hypothetical protein
LLRLLKGSATVEVTRVNYKRRLAMTILDAEESEGAAYASRRIAAVASKTARTAAAITASHRSTRGDG